MAMSAGLGNSQGYWASSFSLDKQAIGVDATYARHGDTFQRILVATPQLAENDRENIRLRLSPVSNFRVIISRNNYLARAQDGSAIRATVTRSTGPAFSSRGTARSRPRGSFLVDPVHLSLASLDRFADDTHAHPRP